MAAKGMKRFFDRVGVRSASASEWLVTLDANDKLIESLAARVRAPPGARLERRLSAPA